MAARCWTADEDDTLRQLHEAGKSLGQVATEMARSKATISGKSAALGLVWERTQVAAATQAKQADNKARRTALVSRLYDRAEEFLEQLDQPHLVFNIGGKDNVYTEHQLDRPPTGDIRNLMQSTSIALQRARDLEQIDAGDGADHVRSILAGLAERFGLTDPTNQRRN